MFDSLLFWHIPSAAFEPVTTTFCVRFHSPSSMLKSYCSFNPLWTMNTTIFQETSNLYHILEPRIVRLLRKKRIPGRSLRSSFIDPFRFAKKRCNTSQGFGALNSCVDWSEGFPNMVLRKMNIYEHRTRVTRFNSLWVSGLTSLPHQGMRNEFTVQSSFPDFSGV